MTNTNVVYVRSSTTLAIVDAIERRLADLTRNAAAWRCVVMTQIWENYAAHDWSGEGICPANWRAKGGRDITLRTWSVEPTESEARALAAEWSGDCNDYFQEEMIGWRLLAPGQLTEDEADRLAWDGQLERLHDQLREAVRLAQLAEWEREQADLLEQEAHDRGRARP